MCSRWATSTQLGILPSGATHWQATLLRASGTGQGSRTLWFKSNSSMGDSLRIGFNSSLNAWWNSPVKPSDPGLYFVNRNLITDSISLLYSLQTPYHS